MWPKVLLLLWSSFITNWQSAALLFTRAPEYTHCCHRKGKKAKLRMLPALIGVMLAAALGVFARASGMDRDRVFYPVVAIVVAHYYVLFAVMGASTHALILELVAAAVFIALATSGHRWSLWIVVVALAGHGLFDLTHGMFIADPGVPAWWPEFCCAFDVTAAVFLAWLLSSGQIRAAAPAK